MATTRRPAEARTDTTEEAPAEQQLARGDSVTVDGKPGRVTGFKRGGGFVYVRFDAKGAGLFPLEEVVKAARTSP